MTRIALATLFVFAAGVLAPAARAQATRSCQIGSFHAASSTFALDVDGNGFWSAGDRQMTLDVAGGAGTPLVGDWNGDGGDDVGKQVGTWYRLDLDGDGVWEGNAGGDRNANFAGSFGPGMALVGDWNGDGRDEIGTYVASSGVFLLDANGSGVWEGSAGGDVASWFARFAGPGQPLVGDWNGDGVDDVALKIPDRKGLPVYVDANGNQRWDTTSGGDRIVRGGFDFPGSEVFATDWDLDGTDQVGHLIPTGGGFRRFYVDLHPSPGFLSLGWLDRLDGGGVALVCDWDGDGSANLGRVIGEVFLLDANGNGEWDGNVGGDLSMGFVPPAGVGAPIAGRWTAPP